MKISKIGIVLTVFFLWFTVLINSEYENYFAYFLVLTIGILHGANDISLIGHLTNKRSASIKKYLITYIVIIGIMSLAFYHLAFPALLFFIFFSCYHFGEQHFYRDFKKVTLSVEFLFVSYGVLIFGLLFYLNLEATTQVITELTTVFIPKIFFTIFLFSGVFSSLLFLLLNRNNFNRRMNIFEELFLILLFAFIFKIASLIWAFAIYFVLWHSIPSLKDQIQTLYGSVNKVNLLKYLKSSLLNWGISMLGLSFIFYISSIIEITFITLFFAFLAAITIPHVVVMYFLNKESS